MSTTPINCGVPHGPPPRSPVLFALTLAEALHEIRPGVSHVDDCSWVIFNSQAQFQAKATQLLNEALTSHGFQGDGAKTEAAWIFASERPRAKIKEQALTWRLRWWNITQEVDIKLSPPDDWASSAARRIGKHAFVIV